MSAECGLTDRAKIGESTRMAEATGKEGSDSNFLSAPMVEQFS
jgi:hypothetical protein